MKRISTMVIVAILSAILIASCKNSPDRYSGTPQTTEMSMDEKEIMKREISARDDEIIKGANSLNVDAAMNPYSNIRDFKIVNPDATVTDFQTMKNAQVEAFKTLRSMNFKTIKQDFTFFEKDLVMCTWTGSNEFQLKSGEKMKIEPYVGSMLFRKQDNEWNIVYAHETTGSPVKVE